MNKSETFELQHCVFVEVAKRLNERNQMPLKVTLGPMNETSQRDIDELKEKQLIGWDLSMKAHPLYPAVSNSEHVVTCIAYYGDAEKGYCCVGFALGSVNTQKQSIEIDFIEKRNDEFSDLNGKFLPLMVEAFTGYANILNQSYNFNINKFSLMNPVDNVLDYYNKLGFKIEEGYDSSAVAMVKSIVG
jgi:hypothetical protein